MGLTWCWIVSDCLYSTNKNKILVPDIGGHSLWRWLCKQSRLVPDWFCSVELYRCLTIHQFGHHWPMDLHPALHWTVGICPLPLWLGFICSSVDLYGVSPSEETARLHLLSMGKRMNVWGILFWRQTGETVQMTPALKIPFSLLSINRAYGAVYSWMMRSLPYVTCLVI